MAGTAQEIFAQSGGQLSFAARLSQAAYTLAATEVTGDGKNLVSAGASAAFSDVAGKLDMLTATELPALALVDSGNASFPKNGISGGIYTHGNAAALVGRSSDALFLTFRGTNDTANLGDLFSGTPDNNQWDEPSGHYAEYAELISAIDTYVAANGITKVYVAGHSLGGAMAQEFMCTHSGSTYEAVTFASIGTNLSGGADKADARQTNIWVNNDIARIGFALSHEDQGDNNFIDGGLGVTNPGSIHDIKFYAALAQFLEASGVTLAALQSQRGINFDSLILQVSEFNPSASTYAFGENSDSLSGSSASDYILGGAESDDLFGNRGRDYLLGGDGNDRLTGGLDKDYLNGGAGSDRFDFNSIKEAGRTSSTRDVIEDMTRGSDRIDFKGIDAKTTSLGNNTFKWIGARDFHDKAGELHLVKRSGYVFVEGDTNGDGHADLRIVVEQVSNLGKSDFIL
jgi:Ca2+-binding RTX toxin-like protein